MNSRSLNLQDGPKLMESPVGAEIRIDGRPYINFGGSSYLGLANVPHVIEAGVSALSKWGSGTSIPTNHGVITEALRDVGEEAALHFGAEDALFMGGGYLFGLVALRALASPGGQIFYDELAHFSLVDGIAASALPAIPFRHLDSDDLEAMLKTHLRAGGRPIIVTDAMFSTFGEIAPLDAYARIARSYEGRLVVDESHGFGVLGERGRGGWEHHGLDLAEILVGGSLGKAYGVCGGVIPASFADLDLCRRTPAARGANPGLAAASAMAKYALSYVRARPQLLSKLRANVAYIKASCRAIGLDVGNSIAPIVSFRLDNAEAMRGLKARLMAEGIFVYRTTYIGAGSEGVIRCAIFADHEQHHLDALTDALRRHL